MASDLMGRPAELGSVVHERDERSKAFKIAGKSIPVIDAIEKVTGTMKFAVDFAVQDMVHGMILRSPHAHATITRIDVSKAEKLPGVLGVVTYEDAPDLVWENAWFNRRGRIFDRTVRFIGDEVAAVAAMTEEIAESALDLIEVEYEPLPAVFDMEEAMRPEAPQLREEGNVRPTYQVAWGNVEEGEREAEVQVECDITFKSQQGAPMGRNACIAEWTGDRVTLWTSSQTPSEVRDAVHEGFGIPQSKIRVIALPVGCSFGVWWSANFMLIAALLARKAGRPVKIELTNEESIGTVKRRHIEHTRGSMGCKKDGTLTFAKFDHIIDNGAYGFKDDVGFFCVDMWGKALHGSYSIHGVNTNTLTAGCMRAVGDVTLGSTVERLADKLAIKIDMDPVQFRLKNQIRPGDELRMQHGRRYMKGNLEEFLAGIPEEEKRDWPELFHLSSGSTQALLEKGAELFDWKGRWKGWGVPNSTDGPRRRAVGVGTGAHVCGVEFEGNTSAVVRINPDGSVKVYCSAGRQGQGSETTLSQVVAEAMGIPMGMIVMEAGDTDSAPWSHGSLASNTMYRIGFAVKNASMDAKRQLLEIAGREFFETDPGDLEVTDGMVHVKGNPGSGVPIGTVMNEIRSSDMLGQTSSITGRSSGYRMPPSSTFARHFAAHFVEVEVDTETGDVRLLDYLAAQDSGTVMNPQILKNQVVGGAVCGAGFALSEHLVFDDGGRILNDNLLDYKVLRAADFPARSRVLFVESYDPVGPFGARGAGEAPAAAPGPAISQAVYNALGVWVDMPMTPERVLRTLGKV
jgi:CO/xanthine dehydrogenase Mo-binding subunit